MWLLDGPLLSGYLFRYDWPSNMVRFMVCLVILFPLFRAKFIEAAQPTALSLLAHPKQPTLFFMPPQTGIIRSSFSPKRFLTYENFLTDAHNEGAAADRSK